MMPNTSADSEKQRIPPKMTRMNDKSLMSINMFVFLLSICYYTSRSNLRIFLK